MRLIVSMPSCCCLALLIACGSVDPLSDLCDPGTIICGNQCCSLCRRDADCGEGFCDGGICSEPDPSSVVPESSPPAATPHADATPGPGEPTAPSSPTPGPAGSDSTDPAPPESSPTEPAEPEAPPPCDAGTCPDGCCDAQGICRAQAPSTCGLGGEACIDCAANGAADSCSPSGSCTCAATGNTCWGATPACTPDGCRACGDESLFHLPATYQKTCDRMTEQCTPIEAGDAYPAFVSGEDRMGYVRFDTSLIPRGARVTDVLFAVYPTPGGATCGGMVGATVAPVDGSPSATPNLSASFAWNPALACGDMTADAHAFGLPGCDANRCTWARANSPVTRIPLDAMVQGWVDGSLPNHGLGFVTWSGAVAPNGTAPGLSLAVCAEVPASPP